MIPGEERLPVRLMARLVPWPSTPLPSTGYTATHTHTNTHTLSKSSPCSLAGLNTAVFTLPESFFLALLFSFFYGEFLLTHNWSALNPLARLSNSVMMEQDFTSFSSSTFSFFFFFSQCTPSLSFSTSSSSTQRLCPFSLNLWSVKVHAQWHDTENFIQAGSPLLLLLLLLFCLCPFTRPSNGETYKHEHTLCSVQTVFSSAFPLFTLFLTHWSHCLDCCRRKEEGEEGEEEEGGGRGRRGRVRALFLI